MTILCEPDARVAAALLADLGPSARAVPSAAEAVHGLTSQPNERLVVLGPAVPMEQVVDVARILRGADPAPTVILVRSVVDPATVELARAEGITEVVAAGDRQGLIDAQSRVLSMGVSFGPGPDSGQEGSEGAIITVFSAKGGCGKTTLATNLAVALAAAGTARVCLVDLDLDFGDVAISLQLTPTRTLVDAAELCVGDQLGELRVDELATPFAPDMDCVLAPAEPGDGDRIPTALVTRLLAELRAHYDYVVVDTPSHFSEHVLAALDSTDHYVLVTTPEIPSLKNLRLTLDMFDLLSYAREKRLIVFNRSDDRTGLTAADIESTVRAPISAHIPSSRDVPVSINKGVPLTKSHPRHPVSVAIGNFIKVSITRQAETSGGRRFGRRKPVRNR
jgi:pilus assembly protein CpaE